MSVSASLSVDVAAAVVTEIVVTVREVTADVMLARARRVHHLESSLLNSVVDSDVDVVELLLLLNLAFRSACFASDRNTFTYSTMSGWLDSSAFGRMVIATAGGA